MIETPWIVFISILLIKFLQRMSGVTFRFVQQKMEETQSLSEFTTHAQNPDLLPAHNCLKLQLQRKLKPIDKSFSVSLVIPW